MGLPAFPAVVDYAGLVDDLQALGARHVAQALVLPGPGPIGEVRPAFRVLDGLWFPGRAKRWRRADQVYVQEIADGWTSSGDPRSGAAAAVLDRVHEVLESDRMGLRWLTLYQLFVLLREHPQGIGAAAAEELGVHPDEAAELAAAVGWRGADREAAEGVLDAWRARRLRQATAFADRLPVASGDHLLEQLRHRISADRAELSGLLDEAAVLERLDRAEEAVACCLRALRLGADEPAAVSALVRVSSRLPGAAGAPEIRAVPTARGVRLTWQRAALRSPGSPAVSYRVLRSSVDASGRLVEVGCGSQRELLDSSVEFGSTVRYAVLPLAGGAVAGRALVGGPCLVAPEVSGLDLTPGRRLVVVAWQAPRGAAAVRVWRRAEPGPGGSEQPVRVSCERAGFVDEGLAPGGYVYTVRCGYSSPDGQRVWSDGVSARVLVEEWPDALEALAISRADTAGAVRVEWVAPERGEVRLVQWPDALPPASGEDLTHRADGLAPLPGRSVPSQRKAVELDLPLGALTRLTAITTLGRRTVAGPTLLLDTLGAESELAVVRAADGTARVSFAWPDPAQQVIVSWTQGGRTEVRSVVRTSYLREGLTLPVDDRPCRVTVSPVRSEAADLVVTDSADFVLPTCVRVSWTLGRPRWRASTFLPVEIRAVRPTTDEESRCPDFRLVALAGTVRPIRPEQGTELLHVTGEELASAAAVVTRLDVRELFRPSVLRAFLTGPHAAGARLQDPPLDALVVR
ncbi:hypothetical protein [Kitasatospora sp. NBC_01266]|uniref:hypothetical protein n=1 Tax=Kitasatospora sp. NBC_01266 TaxID=2903572 RepID=UPI002E32BDA5|nr:hypothetical protein [Kitasatospora sp. NBC_01266]